MNGVDRCEDNLGGTQGGYFSKGTLKITKALCALKCFPREEALVNGIFRRGPARMHCNDASDQGYACLRLWLGSRVAVDDWFVFVRSGYI